MRSLKRFALRGVKVCINYNQVDLRTNFIKCTSFVRVTNTRMGVRLRDRGRLSLYNIILLLLTTRLLNKTSKG